MKKNKNGKLIGFLGLFTSILLLSGCTKSFCTPTEQAKMMYAYDDGITFYYDSSDNVFIDGAEYTPVQLQINGETANNVYYVATISNNSYLKSVIDEASNNNFVIPDKKYFELLDQKTLNKAYTKYCSEVENVEVASLDSEKVNHILYMYGYGKYLEYGTDNLFNSYDILNSEIAIEKGIEFVPTFDFVELYKANLNSVVSANRTCVTTVTGDYGSYGPNGNTIHVEGKTWKEAFKIGFIEGLLVYPIGWLVDTFANLFGYQGNSASGVPQILSILIVTLIVRLFIIGLSLKTTLGQQKMNQVQPELAKIQAKYPNADTNAAQKQRLAQEQMKLYKDHGINPLGSILILFIQFPIFIAVWAAMSGSAILSTGSILGMKMSESISSILTSNLGGKGGFLHNTGGWWTALVLFLLMSAAQIFSTKLPQILQKRRLAKVSRFGKNPAQDQNNNQMKMVTNIMMIMIIIMGFSLPSAMGIYWLIGALISVAQSFIMDKLSNKTLKKKEVKYTKFREE